jgi:hypothetical protein
MSEHLVVSLDDIAAEVRQEHNAARVAARQAIEHAFRAGNLLLQQRHSSGMAFGAIGCIRIATFPNEPHKITCGSLETS